MDFRERETMGPERLLDAQPFFRAVRLLYVLASLGFVSRSTLAEGSYNQVRPDINSVTARQSPALGKEWHALRAMHMEGVAQLIGLYGDRPIYFLARDAELFYDFAKLIAPHSEKIHLLNVSRANEKDPNLAKYLAQEGVTEAARHGGLILYDTGVFGTMSERIRSVLPAEIRDGVQTHLLRSSNVLLPASRVSLRAISPTTDRTSMDLHELIMGYEALARFTPRSDRFEQVDGRWRAMIARADKDGNVDPVLARAYMEDIKAYVTDRVVRKHFDQRLKQWARIRHFVDSKDSVGLKKYLRELQSTEPPGVGDAIVRDTIDALETTFVKTGMRFKPSEFGLAVEPYEDPDDGRIREAFIAHPELRNLLLDHKEELSRLIREEHFSELAAKLRLLGKSERFDRFTAWATADGEPTNGWRKFVREMILERGPGFSMGLAVPLQNPRFQSERWLVEYIIEHGDQGAVDSLALKVFSKPHSKSWDDLLPRLVERMSERGRYMFREVLNQPERQGAPYLKLQSILDTLDKGHPISRCAAALRALTHELRSVSPSQSVPVSQ